MNMQMVNKEGKGRSVEVSEYVDNQWSCMDQIFYDTSVYTWYIERRVQLKIKITSV